MQRIFCVLMDALGLLKYNALRWIFYFFKMNEKETVLLVQGKKKPANTTLCRFCVRNTLGI